MLLNLAPTLLNLAPTPTRLSWMLLNLAPTPTRLSCAFLNLSPTPASLSWAFLNLAVASLKRSARTLTHPGARGCDATALARGGHAPSLKR